MTGAQEFGHPGIIAAYSAKHKYILASFAISVYGLPAAANARAGARIPDRTREPVRRFREGQGGAALRSR